MQGSSGADIQWIGVAKRVLQLGSSTEFFVELQPEALQVLADRIQTIYTDSRELKAFLDEELRAPGKGCSLSEP